MKGVSYIRGPNPNLLINTKPTTIKMCHTHSKRHTNKDYTNISMTTATASEVYVMGNVGSRW